MQPYFLFLYLQFCTTSLVSVSLSHQEDFHSVSFSTEEKFNAVTLKQIKINSEIVVWLSRVKHNLIWCETNKKPKCCIHACDKETHIQGYERAEEVIKRNFPHAKAQKSSIRRSEDVCIDAALIHKHTLHSTLKIKLLTVKNNIIY